MKTLNDHIESLDDGLDNTLDLLRLVQREQKQQFENQNGLLITILNKINNLQRPPQPCKDEPLVPKPKPEPKPYVPPIPIERGDLTRLNDTLTNLDKVEGAIKRLEERRKELRSLVTKYMNGNAYVETRDWKVTREPKCRIDDARAISALGDALKPFIQQYNSISITKGTH